MKKWKTRPMAMIPEIVFYIVVIAGALVMILPFFWMFSTSFRQPVDAYRMPPSFFPESLRLDNYITVMTSSIPFGLFFLNSMKITAAVTTLQIITSSTAAYGFARLRFPGRDAMFACMLAGMMIPAQVTIIPVFIGMSKVGLVDTHLSLILPNAVSVLGVFLLRQFFLSLPRELEDAGKIDGAGYFRIFIQIIMPQVGPGIAALAVLSFNSTWNSYFQPLIFINTWEKMTLPLGIAVLRYFMGGANLSVVMAAVTMAVVPVVVLFLLCQKYFVEGLTTSGIKG